MTTEIAAENRVQEDRLILRNNTARQISGQRQCPVFSRRRSAYSVFFKRGLQ